ncbi:hypothetical protein E4V01_22610 [Methylorubrum sp. Q1]|nr:hypothetical protein Y590_05527 [Methylobacterium sp. AMS5]TFZ55387.1 hypothetical protein E4V01_22610 [Methylorubrum sp. Q1]
MANVGAAFHRRFRLGRIDRTPGLQDGAWWPSPTLAAASDWLGRVPPNAPLRPGMAPTPDASSLDA